MQIEFMGFEQLLKSFTYMGRGMLGVFLVIGVIMVLITLLNKITRDKN